MVNPLPTEELPPGYKWQYWWRLDRGIDNFELVVDEDTPVGYWEEEDKDVRIAGATNKPWYTLVENASREEAIAVLTQFAWMGMRE